MFWVRIAISSLVLLFGIGTTWSLSYKWIILGSLLYAIPLLFQITKRSILKSIGIWIGIFLLTQSLISSYIMERKMKTLKPFFNKTWDVRGGIAGVNGLQRITTDAKGFRVTKTINYDKKESIRIFAFGSSSTEQIFIDDTKTWTHLLQQKLEDKVQDQVEVINAGVSGTRVIHCYVTLENIKGYKPDIAIFYVGMNDAYQHILTYFDPLYRFAFDNTFLGRQIKGLFYTFKNENPGDHSKPEIVYGEDYDRKRDSLGRSPTKTFRPGAVSKNFDKYVQRIIDVCRRNGIICIFMTQRCGYQESASDKFKKGFWMTPPETRYTLDFDSLVYISELYKNYVVNLGANEGVYVFDTESVILPSYDFLYDDCHLNINGAGRISEALSEFIVPIIGNLKSGKVVQP